MGIANVTVGNEPQFSVSAEPDRKDGLLAIGEAAQLIQAANADGQLGVWMDQEERPFGSNVFAAIWTATLMSEGPFRSRTFPELDLGAGESGRRIALLSARRDTQAVAEATLHRAGLEARWVDAHAVRRGDVRFELRLLDVVDRDGAGASPRDRNAVERQGIQ
jgi:hypothetical protein